MTPKLPLWGSAKEVTDVDPFAGHAKLLPDPMLYFLGLGPRDLYGLLLRRYSSFK